MKVFLAHDPAPAFARVTDPVLAIWGSHDQLTEPGLNVPVFLAHRSDAGSLTLMVLPDEDHFFLRGERLAPGEHAKEKMRLSQELIDTVGLWIQDRDLQQSGVAYRR